MDNKALALKALQLRKDVARMIGVGKVGHLGGSCSLADIVTVLYYEEMKLDPQNPKLPDRDRFLLSKGHAALIQYAALGDLGFFVVGFGAGVYDGTLMGGLVVEYVAVHLEVVDLYRLYLYHKTSQPLIQLSTASFCTGGMSNLFFLRKPLRSL